MLTYLNVRVRSQVHNVYRGWGPVRRVYYLAAQARPRITAWPNPLSQGGSLINLHAEDGWFEMLLALDDAKSVAIEISDLMGRVAYRATASTWNGADLRIEIPVPLSPGVYLVSASSGEVVGTTRLFVE